MTQAAKKVFYLSYASDDVYALIREVAGDRFEVVTLEADSDDERYNKISDCDAVICAAYPLTKKHLEAAKGLQIVHHQGVGWQDTTDWQEIKRRDLPLALTTQGTTIGVAEHTVLLMLAAAKRVAFADSELRAGKWHVNTLRGVSRELFGKTIGYIGMGRIAQAVAERLGAFGCDGAYYDPMVQLSEERLKKLRLRSGEFNNVLSVADVLTIHVPLTSETRGLIDSRALAEVKPGAIVVNTARGGIIDEEALAEALMSGHILAAGIDVFEEEPPSQSNPLVGLPNVVLTPHISAGTRDAMRQKMAAIFENLASFFDGGQLKNQVQFP